MFLFCRDPATFQQVKAEGTFDVSCLVEPKLIPDFKHTFENLNVHLTYVLDFEPVFVKSKVM